MKANTIERRHVALDQRIQELASINNDSELLTFLRTYVPAWEVLLGMIPGTMLPSVVRFVRPMRALALCAPDLLSTRKRLRVLIQGIHTNDLLDEGRMYALAARAFLPDVEIELHLAGAGVRRGKISKMVPTLLAQRKPVLLHEPLEKILAKSIDQYDAMVCQNVAEDIMYLTVKLASAQLAREAVATGTRLILCAWCDEERRNIVSEAIKGHGMGQGPWRMTGQGKDRGWDGAYSPIELSNDNEPELDLERLELLRQYCLSKGIIGTEAQPHRPQKDDNESIPDVLQVYSPKANPAHVGAGLRPEVLWRTGLEEARKAGSDPRQQLRHFFGLHTAQRATESHLQFKFQAAKEFGIAEPRSKAEKLIKSALDGSLARASTAEGFLKARCRPDLGVWAISGEYPCVKLGDRWVHETLVLEADEQEGRTLTLWKDELRDPSRTRRLSRAIPFTTLASSIEWMRAGATPLRREPLVPLNVRERERLVEALLDQQRVICIVLVSPDVDAPRQQAIIRCLARSLWAAAWVVPLNKPTAELIAERCGPQWLPPVLGVRVIGPRFTPQDFLIDHPGWPLSGRAMSLSDCHDIRTVALRPFEVDEPNESHAERVIRHYETRAHARALENERLRAHEARDRASEAETRLREVEARQAEIEHQLRASSEHVEHLLAERDALRVQVAGLEYQREASMEEIRSLRTRLDEARNQGPAPPEIADVPPFPDTLVDLKQWAHQHMGGRVILHPSAVEAALRSPFLDTPLIYKSLDLLARFYIPMRTRDSEDQSARLAFEQRLAELNLECTRVGTAVEDRRYRDRYRRVFDGVQRTMDLHLKRGHGFDPAVVFRLYFAWCEETATVYVGHLPGHLENRLTHQG
ncbi:MAG TPA: hypothetical protein PLN91_00995 [Rhodanobacteraceae bacterium]|nr:hypothetical protein [Rhodanobacteraceae bacterium]